MEETQNKQRGERRRAADATDEKIVAFTELWERCGKALREHEAAERRELYEIYWTDLGGEG